MFDAEVSRILDKAIRNMSDEKALDVALGFFFDPFMTTAKKEFKQRGRGAVVIPMAEIRAQWNSGEELMKLEFDYLTIEDMKAQPGDWLKDENILKAIKGYNPKREFCYVAIFADHYFVGRHKAGRGADARLN